MSVSETGHLEGAEAKSIGLPKLLAVQLFDRVPTAY